MTKDEYLKLGHSSKMLEALKTDPLLKQDPDCVRAFWARAGAEEKEWQIETFGFYDPDILYDPLPRDPNDR